MEGEGEGEGEGGGVRILIRTKCSEDYVCDMQTGLYNRWLEFHKVDLEPGKLQENWFPRLKTWRELGQMVLGGEKLYLIGGEIEDLDGERAFVLDTKEESFKWKHFPLPIPRTRLYPNCASLDEKIYHIADISKYSPGAFAATEGDPTFEFWECIWSPPEIAPCSATGRLVADPANDRILVCFYRYGCRYLYAHYPHDRSMKLIRDGDDFVWSDSVALVDDVAYVLSPPQPSVQLLHAYDVSEEGKGKSLDVVWTSTMVEGVFDGSHCRINMSNYGFDALFHVGNNNFWSAYWCPGMKDNTCCVYFVNFIACRSGHYIICTPLNLQIYLLHSTTRVYDFVLLA